MIKYLKILSFLISVFLVVFVVVPAFAEEHSNSSSSGSLSPKPTVLNVHQRVLDSKARGLQIKEDIKSRASEGAQKRQEKLSEARLKLCEARSKNIGERVKLSLKLGKGIDSENERIVTIVDKFYTEKLVPNGYKLSNYADLKADIAANKANVKTLLDAAIASGQAFDCNSTDPKGQLDGFRANLKSLIDANKEYKTSMHNFVKAIRDLAKTAKITKLSPSVAATPEVTK